MIKFGIPSRDPVQVGAARPMRRGGGVSPSRRSSSPLATHSLLMRRPRPSPGADSHHGGTDSVQNSYFRAYHCGNHRPTIQKTATCTEAAVLSCPGGGLTSHLRRWRAGTDSAMRRRVLARQRRRRRTSLERPWAKLCGNAVVPAGHLCCRLHDRTRGGTAGSDRRAGPPPTAPPCRGRAAPPPRSRRRAAAPGGRRCRTRGPRRSRSARWRRRTGGQRRPRAGPAQPQGYLGRGRLSVSGRTGSPAASCRARPPR